MQKRRINDLSSREYEHPFDKSTLEKLESIPGLPIIIQKLYEKSFERIFRLQNTGSYLKISKSNLSKVYGLYSEACAILDIVNIPDLFINFDPRVNGYTSGVEKPFIVITSGSIDLLTDDELLFLIGHELGHIKAKHVLYSVMAQNFSIVANLLGNLTLGIGGIAATGVELALLHWYRMSELSCDRAGLLTCQKKDAAINFFIKLNLPASYNHEAFQESFLTQAKDFEALDFDSLNKFFKIASTLDMTHPWSVMRASELINWLESGSYDEILNKERNFQEKIDRLNFCPNCGKNLNDNDKFCGGCGAAINY